MRLRSGARPVSWCPAGTRQFDFFEQLRAQALDRGRVSIDLVDERWVDLTDAASNEHMTREALLRNQAAAAKFFGLKNSAPSPELGAAAAWTALAHLPRPFDLTLLGMGDDGHTASLFPGSPNLKAALDLEAAEGPFAAANRPGAVEEMPIRAVLRQERVPVEVVWAP